MGRGPSQRPKDGSRKLFLVKNNIKNEFQHHQISQSANFQPNRTKLSNDPKNQWSGSAGAQKGVTTFFGQNNHSAEMEVIPPS